jgi:Icc-related predicted phosphoesterase
MKFAVCSDIHLEFGDIDLKNEDGADVLVLGGDIMVASDLGTPDPHNIMEGGRSHRFREFIRRCSREFPHVVYIMGNHEHYHGDFGTSATKLRAMCDEFENVYFLDKQSVTLGDVIIFGGTLWTDMNKEDPMTLLHIKGMMNDFRCVTDSGSPISRKVPIYKKDESGAYVYENGSMIQEGWKFKTHAGMFTPERAVQDHREFLTALEEVTDFYPDKKIVVCGHHAPSKQSTHPRYKEEVLMNGGYSSDLTGFIYEHQNIVLWTHGHTHEDFDYNVGNCRVVCNPRGYINYEAKADEFKLKTVEV